MTARGSLLAALALVAAAAALDCGAPPPSAEPVAARRVTSNSLRADYAGSEACAGCHAEIHAAWKGSPMRRMTRSTPTEIRGPFDGATLRVATDVATMERRGAAHLVRVSTSSGEQLFRVTRVIGGRHREDYAGVDVTNARDPSADLGRGPETILPVSYVFSTESFRYKGYSVLVPERPGLVTGPVWSQTCIGCHNTLPQVTMLLDDLAGPGAPSFQGSVSDDLLPPQRAARARVTSEPGMLQALAEELSFVGGIEARLSGLKAQDALGRSIHAVERGLEGRHLIEEGIGCEACHGGAAEHVKDPSLHPSYDVLSPSFAVTRDDGAPFTRAEAQNRACARCHTVLFSGYPWTWEGGSRTDSVPGGSPINSGEARDLQLGGCASQLTCTTCHDPHAEDSPAALARFDGPEGNGKCTTCHAHLASTASLAAHSHHEPTGAGSSCLGCHMPRKNLGLAYELTRYHRIGSPTDPERVYGDRPLECALCHEGASADELLSTMARWWNKSFDRRRVAALYGGDLEGSALRKTLALGKPHEQAVAIGVLGERGKPSDACDLAAQIAHPYPLVRYFAKHALERLTRAPVQLDPGRPQGELLPLVKAWCEGSLKEPKPATPP